MSEIIEEKYPQPKQDRRLAPDLPDRGQTRRSANTRYAGEIPVFLHDPEDKEEAVSCMSMDLSQSGMLLTWPEDKPLPEAGTRFEAAFYLPAGIMPEGYESRIRIGSSVVRAQKDGDGSKVAVNFDGTIDSYLKGTRWRNLFLSSVGLLGASVLAILYLRQESIFYFEFDIPVFLYGLIASTFLLSRFVFALFYRNTPVDQDFTPGVTIIIPCFNEEEWIEKTIQCSLNQNYPQDKLEVILVDDGSTDNSMEKVYAFAERIRREITGDRFLIIEQPRNMGKRHAMAAGAGKAKFDLLVFVDSDSFLEPNAVRELVQPFKIPEMGAVSGRTEVQNKWTNALTKMQAVRYYVAFRFFKASESVFDAVTCLSGPLACYRKELVMKYLDAWLNQTFFGYPATFGDDRSLTNFILQDARTGYQDSAVCSTIVPSRMKTFIRQQMRWKRSWLRETLRAGGFMWRKEPFMAMSFYIGFLLPVLAPLIVIRAAIIAPLIQGSFPYSYFLGIFVMSTLMSASYLFLRRSNLWIYGILFCLFYLGVLLWQLPVAIFTFWKSEWGTRSTFADVAYRAPEESALPEINVEPALQAEGALPEAPAERIFAAEDSPAAAVASPPESVAAAPAPYFAVKPAPGEAASHPAPEAFRKIDVDAPASRGAEQAAVKAGAEPVAAESSPPESDLVGLILEQSRQIESLREEVALLRHNIIPGAGRKRVMLRSAREKHAESAARTMAAASGKLSSQSRQAPPPPPQRRAQAMVCPMQAELRRIKAFQAAAAPDSARQCRSCPAMEQRFFAGQCPFSADSDVLISDGRTIINIPDTLKNN